MAKMKRTLAIGAALICLTVACDSEKTPDGESTPHSIPLTELKKMSVNDDPLGELKDHPQIVSEVQYGDGRLIAYVTSDSCGIITTSKNDPQRNDIHLVSKWPSDGQGTDPLPAGPYNSASSNGSAKAWASLLCSKDAMVIEYTPDGARSSLGQIRGEATATQLPGNRADSRIIIGDPATRQQIQKHAGDLKRQ
ncbi:hypothetical protein [Streptomyces sp. NPDC002082]|uniref:hypothetical protein n=1 Tax=Streptomyces sp. NPDC002082 TaxID=3154772 RepID=UPI00331D7E89